MSCKNVCRLCDKLIISQQIIFTGGNLYIFIPEGSYLNCEKYCIVVAQRIPDTATINAPVIIRIGDGAVDYPLVDKCGEQVRASAISTRTKYSTKVLTTATSGSFKLLGNLCGQANNDLASINGDTPT